MKLNDIEKMRREFDEKLANAIKENELNEGIEGYELRINKGTIMMHKSYISGVVSPSREQISEVLRKFPMTEATLYDKKYELPYVIHSSQHYGDKCGKLSIQWKYNEYTICVSMDIDKEIINEFFNVSKRETVDSENTTYASIQQYDKRGQICRYYVPVYNFKQQQQKYYGGTNLLLDEEEIFRIVDYINNSSLNQKNYEDRD